MQASLVILALSAPKRLYFLAHPHPIPPSFFFLQFIIILSLLYFIQLKCIYIYSHLYTHIYTYKVFYTLFCTQLCMQFGLYKGWEGRGLSRGSYTFECFATISSCPVLETDPSTTKSEPRCSSFLRLLLYVSVAGFSVCCRYGS